MGRIQKPKYVRPRDREVTHVFLRERFSTEEQCQELFIKMRWPRGVTCLRCGFEKVYRHRTSTAVLLRRARLRPQIQRDRRHMASRDQDFPSHMGMGLLRADREPIRNLVHSACETGRDKVPYRVDHVPHPPEGHV